MKSLLRPPIEEKLGRRIEGYLFLDGGKEERKGRKEKKGEEASKEEERKPEETQEVVVKQQGGPLALPTL